jgi:diadenosine tetraphosphate (Ap4A) HIT family hydrolase
MSGESCPFCPVVQALKQGETYLPAGSGAPYRRIAELPASIAILGADQFYPGYSLVVAKTHATELYELPASECAQYLDDMVRVARAIARAFGPRKMNYELLGNTVGHLHWHLFPRFEGDPNPMRPVWEHPHEPRVPGSAQSAETIEAIRRHLR